jgi:hypothetical protein
MRHRIEPERQGMPVPAAAVALFGWLVPGGAYLLLRRYAQFTLILLLVSSACAAGTALQGGNQWPQPAELQGLDGFTATMAQASALAKVLAGGPYLLARLLDGKHTFLTGRLHEYGTTLLTMAGLLNLLALADALQLRTAALRGAMPRKAHQL